MSSEQAASRRLTSRTWIFFLGIFLAVCVYVWPSHSSLSSSIYVARRHLSTGDFGDELEARSNASLLARDTYQCSKEKPCSNGACCGKSGYCGYGPTYCGDGCLSDCGAVAECGQYAKRPGRECPLNTCCSQFGFCGTTEDFCTKGCQSNCVLNPSPPGGAASAGILQNKVIGYYESWSARLNCHKVAPTNLPVDALTHVNFAFAYISPGSYEIVTMDGSTPASLFQDTANLKSIKQDLKVFVSVGGWTFSDNGTDTQPLYGEIAADAGKRQTFANNVVHFMKQNGFDGLDIDWEYPGAGDRGGKIEDTANYVSLLQVLRQTFDSSGGSFGLSFTAPSSYWYLRWFDLPNMIKYADWINLMSYDLHGVWDATNPIGSIVQGHTNLTEIKLAAELFWRVNIPPAKIVLGFGFYGRSFTLADAGCSKPGCAFSGASKPGPCSATGGILSYYEIKNILNGASTKKRDAITPTHDEKSAVNYFTFDNDQWVSYDDDRTFKQKVDWANGVGMGGGLIWASDLDDDKYTAHAGLLGRTIRSGQALQDIDKALSNPQSTIQDIAGSNGQNCFAYKGKCVNLNDNKAMQDACGSGFTPIGFDDAGCGKKKCHCGKPICCPVNQAPKNCMWRGDNNGQGTHTDCSAQCAPGEVNIQGIGSSWGGGFLNDGNTNKCGRGYKVFCCPNPDYTQATRGCKYADCRKSCPTGTRSVFSKAGECFIGQKQYCCLDPSQLAGCHWDGGSGGEECSNAKCNATELEIDRAQFGGSQLGGCSWGRQKAACCTLEKAPTKPASCSANLCKVIPGYCSNGNDDEGANVPTKRELSGMHESERKRILDKRGNQKTYQVDLGANVGIRIIAAAYPRLVELFGLQNGVGILRSYFRLILGYCTGTAVDIVPVPPNADQSDFTGYEAEHPIDRQIMRPFAIATCSGVLPSGQVANIPTLDRQLFWKNQLHEYNGRLAGESAIGGPNGPQPGYVNDRIMESFGSYNYPYPFMAVDEMINGAKGRIMQLQPATAPNEIDTLANSAVQQDTDEAADRLLQAMRIGFATFEYLHNPAAQVRFNTVRQQIRRQMGFIEQDVPHANGLVAWWDLFTDDYFQLVGTRAQQWAHDVITRAAAPYVQAREPGPHQVQLRTAAQVLGALEEMMREIDNMQLPPNFAMQNPQPPGGAGGGGSG